MSEARRFFRQLLAFEGWASRFGGSLPRGGELVRKRSALIAAVVSAIMAIPIAVIASHQFDDVPADHTFHDSIGWLADTGITLGCNPPANDEFCPDDPVTRGQMSTFLQRFHDKFTGGIGLGIGQRFDANPASTGNGVVNELSLNLKVPTSGVLVVEGSVDMRNTTAADAFFCGINSGGSPGAARGDSWRVVDLTASTADTCATSTAGLVTPGNYVARIVVTQALGTTQAHSGMISATLYTANGVFGLLGDFDEQTEPGQVSDEPKGG